MTAKEVGEAATQSDELAWVIVSYLARVIGMGFVNLLYLFDPEVIVVGGSVALMGDVLMHPIRATVKECALAPYQHIPIVPAQLGDDSWLLGAAALAMQIKA